MQLFAVDNIYWITTGQLSSDWKSGSDQAMLVDWEGKEDEEG